MKTLTLRGLNTTLISAFVVFLIIAAPQQNAAQDKSIVGSWRGIYQEWWPNFNNNITVNHEIIFDNKGKVNSFASFYRDNSLYYATRYVGSYTVSHDDKQNLLVHCEYTLWDLPKNVTPMKSETYTINIISNNEIQLLIQQNTGFKWITYKREI